MLSSLLVVLLVLLVAHVVIFQAGVLEKSSADGTSNTALVAQLQAEIQVSMRAHWY